MLLDCFVQRSDVKCRERFENLLAPELRRGRWTEEEDARLLSLVDEFGSGNWAEVQVKCVLVCASRDLERGVIVSVTLKSVECVH